MVYIGVITNRPPIRHPSGQVWYLRIDLSILARVPVQGDWHRDESGEHHRHEREGHGAEMAGEEDSTVSLQGWLRLIQQGQASAKVIKVF